MASVAALDERLPAREVRELPEPPRNYWRLVGPGIVAGGVGLSSGEFVLWPYIASQVGLVLLWGALVGVVTQFFINMEVERYTLATGETVLTGFNRCWRHWGFLFCLAPGWFRTDQNTVMYDDPDWVASLVDRIPVGRPGRPGDLEGPVVFLASDASEYITGQTLLVDGGMSTGAFRAPPRG